MTPNSFVEALRQHRLLDSKQWEELNGLQISDPKALAKELLQRGWLTPFQANHLLKGKGQELVLGSYILLERLGEGGMGQVFKARHRNLGRIAAIKLIRKERLDNPSAVKRFHREVRSASALSHPNIVLAYDADEIDGTHLLVMEYVEGAIDLAKLVKTNGPLPVEKACEYSRQAALGLQHAYERGMVHRDIKPANLLLTGNGTVVKVLDMGLARLDDPDEENDKSSTMTQEGSVMGTPDYIAPEQAMDSHTVDIRADLYSLGCTFYFLLTGSVPFPGGSMMQKIMKHRQSEPKAVEKLRPEVPPGVGAVVRKLMAKKPEDRYQTPAELVHALEANFSTGGQSSQAASMSDQRAVVEAGRDSFDSALTNLAKHGDTVALGPMQKKPKNRRSLLAGAVGSCFVVALAVILLLAFKGPADKKLFVKEKDRPLVSIPPVKQAAGTAEDAWPKLVAAMPADNQVKAVAAKLKELNPGFNGKVIHKVEGGGVTELKFVTDYITDISPVRALPSLQTLECSGTPGENGRGKGQLADLSPLKGMKLTKLLIHYTKVSDLSPLKDMRLAYLGCGHSPVSDLSPLKDMTLTELHCPGTPVSDLSPLKDMKLALLRCDATKVFDLSPLKDMKLRRLNCSVTKVIDLSPLKGMNLTTLLCDRTQLSDLSWLKGMPLKELGCDFRPYRDTEILRSIKTLEKINEKPARDFWKEVDEKQAAFEAWCKQVTAMPGEKQVEAVAAKLKEINLGFDGKVTHNIEDGVVTELKVVNNNVTDISPVRALGGLRHLECVGTWHNTGQLVDLSPLKDMKLTELHCNYTKVSDLSPLIGMPLTSLDCGGTSVSDLSPLKDMKLTELKCGYTKVSDLSPLKDMKLTTLYCNGLKVADLSLFKDMKLTSLNCGGTQVSDLSVLNGMKLTSLNCGGTPVSDLSPLKAMKLTILIFPGTQVSDLSMLKEMPLKEIWCDFKPYRDRDILQSIKTLEKINYKPAREFWKEVDEKQKAFETWCWQVPVLTAEKQVEAVAAKLKELNPGFDGKMTHKIENGVVTELTFVTDYITDISPVRALPGLQTLDCRGSPGRKGQLSDLSPLKTMKVTELRCSDTRVSDLSPLKDMKLTGFICDHTPVSDLSPLKDTKLTVLFCDNSEVSDLSPLRGLPLQRLLCHGTKIADVSPLSEMPLTSLWCYDTRVTDVSPLERLQLQEIRFTPKNVTKGIEILRKMKSLTSIGVSYDANKRWPANEFWQKFDAGEFGSSSGTAFRPHED